jgi:LacI family transcriptional regulator
MPQSVKLLDVAKACGVSLATASKALAPTLGRCAVNPATRARVRAMAQQLGYHSDHHLREAIGYRSRAVALLMGGVPLLGDGNSRRVPHAVHRQLAAKGYRLEVVGEMDPQHWPRHAQELSIEGAIMLDPVQPAMVEMLARSGFPVVAFNQPQDLPVPRVMADDAQGTRLAIQHLLAKGHRRIGWVWSRTWRDSAVRCLRAATVFEQMALAGATVVECPYQEPIEVRDWLAQRPVEAVLTAGTVDALLVERAALRLGLQLPRDLALMSCDDDPALAMAPWSISGVAIPMERMADLAVAMVLDHIDGRPSASDRVVWVPETLVLRETA